MLLPRRNGAKALRGLGEASFEAGGCPISLLSVSPASLALFAVLRAFGPGRGVAKR